MYAASLPSAATAGPQGRLEVGQGGDGDEWVYTHDDLALRTPLLVASSRRDMGWSSRGTSAATTSGVRDALDSKSGSPQRPSQPVTRFASVRF